ncbi:lysophospholipid acyltransferase family protein [Streptomyces sp. ME02-6978a]|uniref:lysophospholipid acyltransferase family protein n=1 Tax=unclassified Streptomyces TaxID=2593676 RepID=UPI0029B65104|nr:MULTISPECIES: lysophospholipid acyltransferase family protein [unclassified Streptomyces]MDX3086731.1 lysophospholipid acyltransferase family protein [Streptomyces sp. ME12-02E]MDX3330115.1 lysophospholipid acyltransferase family protein [Streptomyces sp. ME02-6978a]
MTGDNPFGRPEPEPEPEPGPEPGPGPGSGPEAGPGPGPEDRAGQEAGPSLTAELLREFLAAGSDALARLASDEGAVDDFGFDPDLTDELILPLLRPLYEKYFRVEVEGLEHVPADGGALVVANHSGTLPLDALMLQVALRDDHPAHRRLRLLAADLVFELPLVRDIARKAGHVRACRAHATRLLQAGELVGVMPEGYKGLGKPYEERYRLRRFGRGGFAAVALRTGRPLVPCAIVGAEETYPMIGESRTLARMLNLPYFPITPTFPLLGVLGLVPLPSKWTIRFGAPITVDGFPEGAAEDPRTVEKLAREVKDTIQHSLNELLAERQSPFG